MDGELNKIQDELKKIQTAFKMVQKLNDETLTSKLSTVELAKLKTSLAFTIASTYFVLLNITGKEPGKHPITDDIHRIKAMVNQINKIEKEGNEPVQKKLKVDKGAANRIITHHLSEGK